MTPPPAPGAAAATRAPLPYLALIYLLPLAVAVVTPIGDFLGGPQGDMSLYHDKARSLVAGFAPYRDIPLEYPPLALLPMIVPFALWPFGQPSLGLYPWLFAGQMAVLLLALALVVGRIVWLRAADTGATLEDVRAEQRRVAVRLLILALGAALALTWRFDLFPVLLATVAVWAALENRPGVAGAAIGIGVLAKLFPLVVAPAVVVAWLAPVDRMRLVRFAQGGLLAVVVGMAPFIALAGLDAMIWLAYQTLRGLQIESVGGALVLLSGVLAGEQITLDAPFSAWEVTGSLADVFLTLTNAALVLGFAILAGLGWRRLRADEARAGGVTGATIVRLAAASMLLLVVTSKVFSIQYVVWLLPFAALLSGGQFWLAAAAIGLSIPIHPLLYDELVAQDTLPILVLNLRNALLVVLCAWVLRDLARSSPRDVAVERGVAPPEVGGEQKAEARTAART